MTQTCSSNKIPKDQIKGNAERERIEALRNAIANHVKTKDLDFTETLEDVILSAFREGRDDAFRYLGTTVALMSHFANKENIEKLPMWLQGEIGKTLYDLYHFFFNIELHSDRLQVYLDFLNAKYCGGLTKEDFQDLEEKYLQPSL